MASWEQGTSQGSCFLRESATLSWPRGDSTHRDSDCEAADTLKSSHSSFHGNWLVHPPLQHSGCAWEHLPLHAALPGMYFKLHSYRIKKQCEKLVSFTLIVKVLARKTKSLKVAEKERAGQFPAALLLPPPDQDWCGVFSVYLPCYMLSIQLRVTTVSAVQNPLEKSAVVKV